MGVTLKTPAGRELSISDACWDVVENVCHGEDPTAANRKAALLAMFDADVHALISRKTTPEAFRAHCLDGAEGIEDEWDEWVEAVENAAACEGISYARVQGVKADPGWNE